ncbi:DUF6049 family protein [Streptomyces eurocidicus]|uniref:Uncharacterized protein n=2 Tax=Streptomyces eurocidicus TaxID=66423 RepID=A0A7W8BCM9_STREU|nr:DUF6049 family protein [Streptomyces eurocidicus]MBB5119831.1 hypothetical protein [Streptomyces eurocidicus]MBF6050849.1 hypothetical protein [Streptomyces eurocidicus]
MAEAAEFQGTTAAPACRWARHLMTVLLGVLLLVGLVQLPAAPAARAESPTSRPVGVAIDTVTPVAPTQNDTITLSGTVTNNSGSTVTDAHVGLRVGPQISGRSDIDDLGYRAGFSPGTDGAEIGKHTQKIDKLAPGISREFSISLPAKDLELGHDGVYQLGVSLSGRSADHPYEGVLGIQRTLLPWQPSGVEGKKTQLTFLWPLISATHLTARTEKDQQQTPIFPNDDLAAELAPGGRLNQLVALGKDLKITWVIDPDLLATVEAMTKSYRVDGPDGKVVPGKGQAVAKQWLSQLQTAVAGHQVVALPFGDPDLASLAHRGKDVSGSLSHLQSATELAATTVDTILGVKPRTDFAWPVDGAVDSSIIDVATSAGAHNVIARSDSIREPRASYTPSAARQIGGGNTAVVADARMSTVFQGDLIRADNSSLAVQRFLAQSLLVNRQAPDDERSIVVAPQRMPTTSQAQAMATAINGLSEGRWTQPLDLGDAAKAKPDASANQQVPGSGSYPEALREQELPTEAFQEIQKTQSTLDSFKVILTSEDRVVTPFGSAIMREMSTSWRGNRNGAADFRDAVQSYLYELTRQVQLIKKSDATLSGRDATLPITVQNGLLQGIDGLRLVLESSQPNRLKVDASQPVKIEGGHRQTLKFETRANANGPVKLTAQLYTDDGQPYGKPMYFTVHVTSITPMVLLVIAGGVLLLILAGLRIYLQRKRSAARGTADGGAPGAEGDGPGDGGPGDDRPAVPGDPAPDTGSESTDPSGTGEKVDR